MNQEIKEATVLKVGDKVRLICHGADYPTSSNMDWTKKARLKIGNEYEVSEVDMLYSDIGHSIQLVGQRFSFKYAKFELIAPKI